MKNFSDYLERAIRHGTLPPADDDGEAISHGADGLPSPLATDWSPYYVNYNLLKSHISSYMRRRLKLAELLRDSNQVYLTEEDLRLVLATADDLDSTAVPTDSASDDDVVRMVMMDELGHGRRGVSAAEKVLGLAACDDYFQYVDEPQELQPLDPAEAERRLSRVERSSFTRLLDTEVERAATFYSTQLVYLARSIAALDGNEGDRQAHEQEQYECVGNEILELLAFVVTNIICLRQILIRYDAFVRTFDGQPLAQWYFQEKMGERDGSSSDYIADLFHLDALLGLEMSFATKMTEKCDLPSPSYLEDFAKQAAEFRFLLDKTSISVSRAAGGHIIKRDQLVHGARVLQHYFLLGSGLRGLAMEPKLLLMRGRHLKAEMKQCAEWRETQSLEKEDEGEKLHRDNILPLALNLLACFLYMLNNYIIEPSAAYYAEALGSSDSMAGLMIGLSPVFAIMSAIGYSIWTNYNYKSPIIFACSLAFVGNLLYASALSYNSMAICLVGRALTGLGATKVINRRYVADTTPFSLRTPANAAFALFTALGAAMGPAMAIVIADLDFEFVLPFLGSQNFNAMTGPGFFMALMWFLYTVVASCTFTEPVRSGLDELVKREESAPAPLPDNNQSAGKIDDDLDEQNLEEAKKVILNSSNNGSIKHCLRNMTRPVCVTMCIIFMKRVALEFLIGSTSVITKNRYGWSIKNVGTLHFVNGMVVIPISILSGWLSQFYQDRYLTLRVMAIALVGMFSLIDFTDLFGSTNENENYTYNEGLPFAIGPVRYIIGSLVAFSSIEANESYVASMMSKILPSQLAVGTFNSGFLINLVSTSARAFGDIFITILGSVSIRNLLNLLIIPSTGLIAMSIFLVWRNYEAFAV